MKQERLTPTPRKRRIFTPLLFRRIHKWAGLLIGLQFVLWTLSGAVMALLDQDAVGGHGPGKTEARILPWPANLASLPAGTEVEGLTLRKVIDRPVYEVRTTSGVQLIDASSGATIDIRPSLAVEIARSSFHQDAPVRSVSRLQRANLEARDHEGPMWRVDFADEANSSAYVHAETGRPLVTRTDTWRIWDFAWMLHNMDYASRKSFNHPLITFMGFGALWLSFTGFYLLFKSFRRREFRWLLPHDRRGKI